MNRCCNGSSAVVGPLNWRRGNGLGTVPCGSVYGTVVDLASAATRPLVAAALLRPCHTNESSPPSVSPGSGFQITLNPYFANPCFGTVSSISIPPRRDTASSKASLPKRPSKWIATRGGAPLRPRHSHVDKITARNDSLLLSCSSRGSAAVAVVELSGVATRLF